MFPAVDTRDASAVAEQVGAVHRDLFPEARIDFVDRLFTEVGAMYAGQFGSFQTIDVPYHDFQHTLQVTLCLAELLDGRARARAAPPFSARRFELGIAAALLHDTGYLKDRGDHEGTGAKYTYTHVLRSCAIAASYLPRLGVTLDEVDGVLAAIRCTGPTTDLRQLTFHDPLERTLACCVATADYVAQMAASDYPEELVLLHGEFEECDDYLRVPREERVFPIAEELIRKTPAFWRKLVKPKLHSDFEGVCRYLARPYPDGPNAYLLAIERNIAAIAAMTPAAADSA